jgi:hypothetical protein
MTPLPLTRHSCVSSTRHRFRRTLSSRSENADGENLQRKRTIHRYFKHVQFNSSIIIMAWIDSLQHRINPLRFILPPFLQISRVRSLSLSIPPFFVS